LITTAPSLLVSRRRLSQNDISRRGFERLNNIEKEVFPLQFDLRNIRDDAHREGQTMPGGGNASARKTTRPFQRMVGLQLEKNRRDRNLRLRMQKEKQQEQTRNERRDDLLNKAMRPRTAPNKQHRNKKSMSAFLQFMRPISSAFSSDTLQSVGLKRSAAELDFPVSGKPAMVVSLMDARASPYINKERSFTFQLDTEDGGHYLLQAMTRKDLNKWLETIQRVANLAAKRRLTYIGNSPQPQLEDHIPTRPLSASKDPIAGAYLADRVNSTV
jgi:GTPase-activating protein BEM2